MQCFALIQHAAKAVYHIASAIYHCYIFYGFKFTLQFSSDIFFVTSLQKISFRRTRFQPVKKAVSASCCFGFFDRLHPSSFEGGLSSGIIHFLFFNIHPSLNRFFIMNNEAASLMNNEELPKERGCRPWKPSATAPSFLLILILYP